MKRMILAFVLLSSIMVNAQSDKYAAAMQKTWTCLTAQKQPLISRV